MTKNISIFLIMSWVIISLLIFGTYVDTKITNECEKIFDVDNAQTNLTSNENNSIFISPIAFMITILLCAILGLSYAFSGR